MKKTLLKLAALIVLTSVFKDALAADTASGSSVLPYETWLKTIQKSLTGPVAFSVSLIGIVSCGATLIFTGGEMGRFMRSIVYLVMVMTLLVGANNLMSSLFNGATVEIATVSNEIALNDKESKSQEKPLSDRITHFNEQNPSSKLQAFVHDTSSPSPTLIDSPKVNRTSHIMDTFNDVNINTLESNFSFSFHKNEALIEAC